MRTDIHDLALGRWRTLLPSLGIHEQFLTGKHGPCPACGGEDRFRWDNQDGRGSFFCSKCGPGSGVDLVINVLGVDFHGAKKLIEEKIGETRVEPVKARRGFDASRHVDRWRSGLKLDGRDLASVYLRSRGLVLDEPPAALRFLPRCGYFETVGSKPTLVSTHPALSALFVSPDLKGATVQNIYLADNGEGKASVAESKKTAPGRVPIGGAVRLGPSAEVMGIASGIETALAASIMFGLPVWATLTDGNLIKWDPPERAQRIVIFGDNDASFCGQAASYTLAHRLQVRGYAVDIEIPARRETDWCDVLAIRGSRKEIT